MGPWAAPAAAPVAAASAHTSRPRVPVSSRLELQACVREQRQNHLPAVQTLCAVTGHCRPEPEPQNVLPAWRPVPASVRGLTASFSSPRCTCERSRPPRSVLFRALSVHGISPGCGPRSDTRVACVPCTAPHRGADSGVCGRGPPRGLSCCMALPLLYKQPPRHSAS